MLIDEVVIKVKGGNGGNGSASFKRNAQTAKGGPDGGNGGNGGNAYVAGINDFTSLSEFTFKKEIRAEDGVNGGKQNLFGRNGKDIIFFVPIGTTITNLNNNEIIDIVDVSSKILISKGGKGGRGNNEFKSATNQAPKNRELGEPGEEKHLRLELKLIADIGLIGLPNAGKSSLLSVLTNAHPKIANYPFTTLEPNLGVMEGLVLADIPGLIEGASTGKGLGDKFLKHIEKTKMLIHCIDITSEDLVKDYKTIRKELGDYNISLLDKNEVVVLTKTDLISKEELNKKIKLAKKFKKDILILSIYNQNDLSSLKNLLLNLK